MFLFYLLMLLICIFWYLSASCLYVHFLSADFSVNFQMILLDNSESQRRVYEKKCEDMAQRLRDSDRTLQSMQKEIGRYQVSRSCKIEIGRYQVNRACRMSHAERDWQITRWEGHVERDWQIPFEQDVQKEISRYQISRACRQRLADSW